MCVTQVLSLNCMSNSNTLSFVLYYMIMMYNYYFIWKLTVDADNFDHCEDEEGQWSYVHFDKHRCQQEHHQNDCQAARDPQFLRNPESNKRKNLHRNNPV